MESEFFELVIDYLGEIERNRIRNHVNLFVKVRWIESNKWRPKVANKIFIT